jgi:hypothetical protein
MFWLAYSIQHMSAKDKNQYLREEGVGIKVCHVPIVAKGGIFALL